MLKYCDHVITYNKPQTLFYHRNYIKNEVGLIGWLNEKEYSFQFPISNVKIFSRCHAFQYTITFFSTT